MDTETEYQPAVNDRVRTQAGRTGRVVSVDNRANLAMVRMDSGHCNLMFGFSVIRPVK